jgi:hypothetical protein
MDAGFNKGSHSHNGSSRREVSITVRTVFI